MWKKAGGANRAYVETVPVEVTDGKFKITFTSNVENPQINAIEIIPQATGTPAAPTPAKEQGAIRIKAGSSAPFTDSAGNVWKAEEGFEGGSVIERPEIAIANTKDAGLYRSEHYSMDSFSCTVPNGKYTARLHFAETYEGITGEGQRVFSFNVQGHEFKDFDVWKKAGRQPRYVETVPVEVTDGKFKITFTSNIENPQINAIEILPQSAAGPAAPTPDCAANHSGAQRDWPRCSRPWCGRPWWPWPGGATWTPGSRAAGGRHSAGTGYTHQSLHSPGARRRGNRHNALVQLANSGDFDIMFLGDSITDLWNVRGARGATMSSRSISAT